MNKDFLTITPESGGYSYITDMRPQTCLFETKRTPRPQVCSKLGQGTRSMDMG